jgi:LCP family protein required for cell wall assembly
MFPALGALGVLVAWLQELDRAVHLAFDPDALRVVVAGAGVVIVVWFLSVLTTWLMVRPAGLGRLGNGAGAGLVALACLAAVLPVVQGMRYAMTQADLVQTVFEDNESATAPRDVSEEDPWGGRDRVSVLLLGGDGGRGREGVRTDTMILLSMSTRTGEAVMFSLPRNMMNAQFPEDSPLHDVYPDGFRGEGDPGAWMLNAVYRQVPALYPQLLGRSADEGADALKQAVAGSLGTRVDYYLLVNLDGFKDIVDAVGGVTVNVNEPVAIQGDTDRGIPPVGYLQPGPDQHLDGYHALWFARGRWGSDDYQRMLRQRCVVHALIDELDPMTLLQQYQDLARTGKEILSTDIPRTLLPAFVDLGRRVKGHEVRSIPFVASDRFFSGDPDFDWMRATVDAALAPRRTAAQQASGGAGEPAQPPSGDSADEPTTATTDEPTDDPAAGTADDPGTAVAVGDACGYHPVG